MSDAQLLTPPTDAESTWRNYERKKLPSVAKLLSLAKSYTFHDVEESVR